MLTHICMVVVLAAYVKGADVRSGSVYCDNLVCKFELGKIDKNATAYGVYNDSLDEVGWGKLDIWAGYGHPNFQQPDDVIMYAAGYLEGALTTSRIFENFINLKQVFFDSMSQSTFEYSRKFLADQDKWTREMTTKYNSTDPFWRQVGHVTAQLDGLHGGYNDHVEKPEEKLDFYIFQALSGAGDLTDIANSANISNIPDWRTMSRAEVDRFLFKSSRCSAVVKVTDDIEDIFMGHSTWFLYQGMMRIYKYWNFNLADPFTTSKRMSFSSYPGFLVSVDDFYVLADSRMVMLQTTNSIFNEILYTLIQPKSLLAWQRVRVANMAATSGQQWADLFKRYNSGTYPNQYMLIDLKRFHPKEGLDNDVLWVVEQIPGLVVAEDQTQILWEGYWPSYNIPFYEAIYNVSGYPEFVATHGPDYSYQLAPRAKIFRRDHAKIDSITTIQQFLRYNDYQNDEFSENNACYSICCRGDLLLQPFAGGCIDTKVTDLTLSQSNVAWIISGPTIGYNLPPFQWTDEYKNVSHFNLPEKYDFEFVRVEAATID